MRALVLAGAAVIGIGLLGTSGASAAPANGIVIDRSAAVIDQSALQEVRWGGHHRCCWHHHRGHWRWGSRGWHSRWRSWHRW
jgi:hypothetical protein